jgi:hypothetical protein
VLVPGGRTTGPSRPSRSHVRALSQPSAVSRYRSPPYSRPVSVAAGCAVSVAAGCALSRSYPVACCLGRIRLRAVSVVSGCALSRSQPVARCLLVPPLPSRPFPLLSRPFPLLSRPFPLLSRSRPASHGSRCPPSPRVRFGAWLRRRRARSRPSASEPRGRIWHPQTTLYSKSTWQKVLTNLQRLVITTEFCPARVSRNEPFCMHSSLITSQL